MTQVELKLKEAKKNIDSAKKLVEKELEKEDNNPKKQLYLHDYKIELFDIQLRLKDMLKNISHIK